MTTIIDGSLGITTPMYGGSIASNAVTPVTGFKNRIINGAMVIDQRNAGASVSTTTTGNPTYTVDRWAYQCSVVSKFTVQQNAGSVTTPIGFINYLGVTSTSSYSVGASDLFLLNQCVEGLNVTDLGWGTANAKTVTLSFWVYSSLTGAFGGSLSNSAFNRSYPFSYTISSANTWEQKTVTIAGDTTGTWLTTNGIGIRLYFGLGVGLTYSGTAGAWTGSGLFSATGATSVVGTNNATFYITGVQLEVGTNATSFDYRPYGTELALCQRYYYKFQLGDFGALNGFIDNSTNAIVYYQFPVPMRTYPTLGTTGTAGNYGVRWSSATTALTSVPSIIGNGSISSTRIQCVVASGLTTGQGCALVSQDNSDGKYLAFSSEL